MRVLSNDEADDAEAQFAEEGREEFSEDSPKRRKASAFEKNVTQKILSKTLLHTFKLIGTISRSDAEFAPGEFDEPAQDIIDVVNRFKLLRLVVNVWHPLVSASRLWEKVQKIRNGRQPAPAASEGQPASNGTAPLDGERIYGPQGYQPDPTG